MQRSEFKLISEAESLLAAYGARNLPVAYEGVRGGKDAERWYRGERCWNCDAPNKARKARRP